MNLLKRSLEKHTALVAAETVVKNQWQEMDFEKFKRDNIVKILQKLRLDLFLKKYSPRTVVTSESFEKLTPLQFRLICYFLFYKLNPEACHTRFRNVFPSRDLQQEAEFRRLCIEYINELAKNQIDPLVRIEKIPPIHYQRLSGHVFVEQMFNLSVYVLLKYAQKFRSSHEELNKLDSIADVENLVQQHQNRNNQFASELREYEQNVENKCKEYEKEIAVLNEKLIKLKQNGPLDEIIKVNDHLEKELNNMDRNLRSVLTTWRNSQSLITMMRPTAKHTDEIQSNCLKNFGANFFELFKQFEEFVKIIKNSPSKWIVAFKHYDQFNRTNQELKCKVEESEAKIQEIERKQEELRSEILAHPDVMDCRKRIEEHVEPLLNLDLRLGGDELLSR